MSRRRVGTKLLKTIDLCALIGLAGVAAMPTIFWVDALKGRMDVFDAFLASVMCWIAVGMMAGVRAWVLWLFRPEKAAPHIVQAEAVPRRPSPRDNFRAQQGGIDLRGSETAEFRTATNARRQ